MVGKASVRRAIEGTWLWGLGAAALAGLAMVAIPLKPFAEDLPRGEVIPRVACKTAEGFSYALYLPKDFTPEKRWPVIFCFSPAGRGEDPVRLLSVPAEHYGYIVAGSNDSRNGPVGPILKAQRVMWEEINARFPVDPARSYSTGFSGGSRAALYLALSHRKNFAGVISCGAFDAEGKTVPKACGLALYMLVGDEDFNLFEFTRFDKLLAKRENPHWLEEFDGPHQWPPAPYMIRAVEYLQADAMKRGLIPRDADFLEKQVQGGLDRAAVLETNGLLLRAYREVRQTGEFFSGIAGADKASQAAARLGADPRVKEALDLQATFEDYHERLVGVSSTETLLGTLREVDKLRKQGGQTGQYAGLLLRMSAIQLAQLGADLLRQGRYQEAAFCFETSVSVLPGNRVNTYNAACAFARIGQRDRAIDYLRQAVAEGFNDRAFIEKDPDLKSLQKEPAFVELMNAIGKP
jgi:tetratricopeptide (TPR) repeat protein